MQSFGKKQLQAFEDGKISRRELIRGLAVAASAAGIVLPSLAAESKKLKTTWVNHYIYVAPDLKKTSDWYAEVFGMQMAHRDAKEAHMWYGDKGGDTLMIIRQGAAGEPTKIINFAFTVDNWDKKEVEANLKSRNIAYKSDTDKCLRFKDMEGFDIAVCAKDYMKRPSASDAKPKLWKTLSANHIVELSPDYGKLRDWYADLMELRITRDSKRDVYMWLGDTVWIPTQLREGAKSSVELGSLDHVAYTVADYNKEAVLAELTKMNLNPRVDTDLSFNCVDVNGFKTQVCDKELVPFAEKRAVTAAPATKQ